MLYKERKEVKKMATLAELTAEKAKIQAQIDKILVAQEYSEGGTSVKKVQLQSLYDRLDTLDARIGRINSGCIALSPVFGGK